MSVPYEEVDVAEMTRQTGLGNFVIAAALGVRLSPPIVPRPKAEPWESTWSPEASSEEPAVHSGRALDESEISKLKARREKARTDCAQASWQETVQLLRDYLTECADGMFDGQVQDIFVQRIATFFLLEPPEV